MTSIQTRLCCLLLFVSFFQIARIQAQEVPEEIAFAGITLKLSPKAKNLIQNQVNLLLEDQATFTHKVKIADTFMPLITDILQKNELPLDFKFLALLDDTSPDSLVFWQMSKELGLDLGLQINDEVDERENIYTVSEKIANFLKINHVVLQNWWLTLLSYPLKSGDPVKQFQELFPGVDLNQLALRKEFTLDEKTHPQILKLIAQAVAYNDALSLNPQRDIELVSYPDASGLSLEEVAQNFSLPNKELKKYNSWLKTSKIPQDKKYDLLVPMPSASPTTEVKLLTSPSGEYTYTTANEANVHVVESGETLYRISRQYNVSVLELIQWNRLERNSVLHIGQKLYITGQNSQNPVPTPTPTPSSTPSSSSQTTSTTTINHYVKQGETLYRISRKYDVSVREIKNWNGLSDSNLSVGQVIKIKTKTASTTPNSPSNTPTNNNNPNNNNSNSGAVNPIPVPTPSPNTSSGGNYSTRSIKTKLIPDVMYVGGIQLNITRKGRKAIQKDVNLLIKNQNYFFKKLYRVDLYMPLIEDILSTENVPMDFKYLPIQESALIAAATSRSQAVGYWQFKEASGKEVGLTINNRVDERMNIVASSQAACKYLKRNNLYYNNWIIALLSYNMGFTGAKFYVNKHYPNQSLNNIKTMHIDENTHWYIRKFLAHKIAFEQEIGLEHLPKQLSKYTRGRQKTLKQIAQETQSFENDLKPHNLWLKKNRIPDDKTYTVIVPLKVN